MADDPHFRTVTRRFTFCAAHRLPSHEGKCRRLHGHNYVALVTFAGDLDANGMVVDFGVVKDRVGGLIDSKWDHRTILHTQDPLAKYIDGFVEAGDVWYSSREPTAEHMAEILAAWAQQEVDDLGVRVMRVQLFETENCSAEIAP